MNSFTGVKQNLEMMDNKPGGSRAGQGLFFKVSGFLTAISLGFGKTKKGLINQITYEKT
jgi:hypothetical protein